STNGKVIQLIGSESFDPSVRGAQVFGAVRKVSPLYIIDKEDRHHHALRTIPKWQNSGKKVYQVPALASSSGIKIKTSTGGQEIQSDLNLLVEYDFVGICG
ncbi:MAG: hypothetical protein AAFQ92_29635, partial [Bacteroidota bacterium]